jgi:hypothetical protein
MSPGVTFLHTLNLSMMVLHRRFINKNSVMVSASMTASEPSRACNNGCKQCVQCQRTTAPASKAPRSESMTASKPRVVKQWLLTVRAVPAPLTAPTSNPAIWIDDWLQSLTWSNSSCNNCRRGTATAPTSSPAISRQPQPLASFRLAAAPIPVDLDSQICAGPVCIDGEGAP